MDNVTAITGEHVVLEGDTIEIEGLHELEIADELELVDDKPTDPYNTSTVKVLRPGMYR
jgi:hypothetical protein